MSVREKTSHQKQSRSRRMFQSETEQHRRVLEVANAVSVTVGGDFFRSLVQHLSIALTADLGYLGELIHGPRR